jgi:hypothetical protein
MTAKEEPPPPERRSPRQTPPVTKYGLKKTDAECLAAAESVYNGGKAGGKTLKQAAADSGVSYSRLQRCVCVFA